MSHLAHKIYLRTNAEQEQFFARACGVARFTYNWALNQCNEIRFKTKKNPNLMQLKKQWNAIKEEQFPWVYDSPKDANQDPFSNLQTAWDKFWKGGKQGKRLVWNKNQKKELLSKGVKVSQMVFAPKFKSKRDHQSFYLSNDKFKVEGQRVKLPKVGWLELKEPSRFEGKILSGVIAKDGDGWYIAIAVDVVESQYYLPRTTNGIVGIDLGIKTMAVLSNGITFENKKPFKTMRRRLAIRQRRASRKYETQKKEGRKDASNNLKKQYARVAKVQTRVRNIRRDAQHKFTTQACRENQAIIIENLNVVGMMKNRKLSQALMDVGLGEIVRQITYKVKRFSCLLGEADRWFPSSKLCSTCGCLKESLKLSERFWTCKACNTRHDRDENAGKNLENLLKIRGGYREIYAPPNMNVIGRSGRETKQSAFTGTL